MSFPLDRIKTTPGKTELFQVGICLSSRKFLGWGKKQPILPQTVQMVKIQAPQPISKTLQYINACPNLFTIYLPSDEQSFPYPPVAVIRAANHLRTLGKQDALAALNQFARLSYDNFYKSVSIPENLDTSSRQSLEVIIPVLFPNIQIERGLQPIMVWESIPFRVNRSIRFTTGARAAYDPSDLLKKAETKGELLEQPLRPANNPLLAADTLRAKLYGDEGKGRFNKSGIELRYQAMSMIHQLLGVDVRKVPDLRDKVPDLRDDEEWNKLKTEAERLKIHWDEGKQEYVAGVNGK